MNISVNGQSRVPPGVRFHPTEEELLLYYLRKKVGNETIDLDVIFEVDLNKLEPWDIQERCKIGSAPQNDWYFFSHKDKKYPTGTRTNRATAAGFWKATGRDKVIYSNSRRIGMRKTLVFYKGRAPHGQKSDWIMHEYRLDETTNSNNDSHVTSVINGDLGQEEGWVVCRIFKKKNHFKTLNNNSSINTIEVQSTMLDSPTEHDDDHHNDDQGALEQIFQYMGTHKPQNKNNASPSVHHHHMFDRFLTLPSLDSPNNSSHAASINVENVVVSNSVFNSEVGLGDWAALDLFVVPHLLGQPSENILTVNCDDDGNDIQLQPLRSTSTASVGNKNNYHVAPSLDNYGDNEIDLWSFTKSSLPIDPLCHVSNAGL